MLDSERTGVQSKVQTVGEQESGPGFRGWVKIGCIGYRLQCVRMSTMQTIQVVLDERLLNAADVAAKRDKVNRSALIRRALADHLKRLQILDLEERDRRGYEAKPQRLEECLPWEAVAVWPEG